MIEYLFKNRMEEALEFFKSKMKKRNLKPKRYLEGHKFQKFQVNFVYFIDL